MHVAQILGSAPSETQICSTYRISVAPTLGAGLVRESRILQSGDTGAFDALRSRCRGAIMTDSALAAPRARSSDFRPGAVIVRSRSLVQRHLLMFFIVSFIACSPMFLFAGTQVIPSTASDP